MKKKYWLKLAYKWRVFLYFLHGHSVKGLMTAGKPCQVEDPTVSVTFGDVIHPCVRYIEEGFEGHKWWMVYTPYYGGNDKIENPRLCYADADNEPPTNWKFYCTIKDTPECGYNSDPTLLFFNEKLYVFWRECNTPKTREIGCGAATFGCYVKEKSVVYISVPQLVNLFSKNKGVEDNEVCPTIIKRNGKFYGYSMHHNFVPNFIYNIPSKIGSLLYKYHIFFILDALFGYKDLKNIGISIWVSSSLEHSFCYLKTIKIKNISRLYQSWHMDIFMSNDKYDNRLYAVIQSSIEFADICFAWSDDGELFNIYSPPLITTDSIGLAGIYKPSALLVGKKLYVYYTARDSNNNHLNRLFVTEIDWCNIIGKLGVNP